MKKLFCALFLTLMTPALFAATTADQETIVINTQLSLKKITVSDKKSDYEIDATYPQLISDTDNATVLPFNQKIQQFITNTSAHFKTELNKASRFGNSLSINYKTNVTTLHQETILSILFESEYFTGGAHPWHTQDTFNYNVANKQFLQLKDLFKPNSKYLTAVSDYCYNTLKYQLEFKDDDQVQLDWLKHGTAPTIKNYRHWTLQKDGLLIYFDEYQVAAYVFGRPTVLIPFTALQDVLVKASA